MSWETMWRFPWKYLPEVVELPVWVRVDKLVSSVNFFASSKKTMETFIRPGKPVVVKFVEPAIAHHDLARDGEDAEYSVTLY
mmetsp:Transcript_12535/g.21996  ORF Transcript_12535/g.21996 Transcript_12535/m.21996 type:complete len:82 (-) Transcript_12535:87-332(-)